MKEFKRDNKNNYKNNKPRPNKPQRQGQPQERLGSRDSYGEEEKETSFIVGRNAVKEALKSGRPLDKLFIQNIQNKSSLGEIIALAKERNIPIKELTAQKLNQMSAGENHQGVIISCSAKEFVSLDEAFDSLNGEAPFFVIADEIEDPHNLGAIIRTAESAGANAVIIPKRRGVSLTSAVARTSAGAIEHMNVVRVTNLVDTIKSLQKRGVWVYCADMDGERWCQANLTGPLAIVIGSEGRGVGRLIKESCDGVLSLPMNGKINSLNASVACGIILYEATRQRLGIKSRG